MVAVRSPRRRDPEPVWPLAAAGRRSPSSSASSSASRAFEEQLQRVDEDDFLADTPLGQRRQLGTPKEDAPTKTDEDGTRRAQGRRRRGRRAPAAPRGYAYSWSSSSVTQNGETRTTVRQEPRDAATAPPSRSRSAWRARRQEAHRDAHPGLRRRRGQAELRGRRRRVRPSRAPGPRSRRCPPPRLLPPRRQPRRPHGRLRRSSETKEEKEELAADAEIAKLKAELKALRGDPLPPADYGTTQV